MEKNREQTDTFVLTDTIITHEYNKWLIDIAAQYNKKVFLYI